MDEDEKELLSEEAEMRPLRRAYICALLGRVSTWAIVAVALAAGGCYGFWAAYHLVMNGYPLAALSFFVILTYALGRLIYGALRALLLWAKPVEERCRNCVADMLEADGFRSAERFSNLFYFMAIGLMIVASVLCGIFWQQCGWLHVGMQRVLASPFGLSVALCISFACLLGVVLKRPQSGVLWPVLMGPVLFFWLLAAGEHFCWESLYGVFLCLGALLLLFFPFLRKREEVVRRAEPDIIGRRLLYQRMGSRIRYLLDSSSQRGVTVVVTGAWGSGKSHFINYLASSLQELYVPRGDDERLEDVYVGRFTVCSVDLWRSKDKEAMWNDIAAALAAAISGRQVLLLNRWRLLATEFLQAFHLPVFSLADTILRVVTSGVDDAASAEGALERRINYPKNAYILVLDNLDRCDQGKVEALFPLIERLRRIRGLVTICAIAPEVLAHQCERYHGSGYSFTQSLLKVFDVSLPLPKVPVKYVNPFLLREVENLKLKCPHIRGWIQRQKLRFDTPRQMENIIHQLGLLDNCYLSRDDEEEYEFLEDDSELRIIDAAFYMAALRVAAPTLAGVLERAANPTLLLSRTKDLWGALPPDVPVDMAENSGVWTEWCEVLDDFRQSELLKSLVEVLSELDTESLTYAIEQAYLRMSALTRRECRDVIKLHTEKNVTPRAALKLCFPKDFIPVEEEALYRSVLEYALKRAEYTGSYIRYVEECLENDIIPEHGHYHIYAHSPEILMQLIDAVYCINSQSSDHYEEWKSLLGDYLKQTDTQVLCVVLNELAGEVGSADELPLLWEYGRHLYRERRRVSPLRRRRNAMSAESLSDLCGMVFRQYAQCICADIISADFVGEHGLSLFWGNEYMELMLSAVDEVSIPSYVSALHQRMRTYGWRRFVRAICPSWRQRDKVFCEYNYAQIWWRLFSRMDGLSRIDYESTLWMEFMETLRGVANSPAEQLFEDDTAQRRSQSKVQGACFLLQKLERNQIDNRSHHEEN